MKFKLEKLLFFDVETVSQYENLTDMSDDELKVWQSYYTKLLDRVTDETKLDDIKRKRLDGVDKINQVQQEVYRQTAGLFPEFGKVCCVSVGFVTKKGVVKIDSYYGEDEEDILLKTRDIFNKVKDMDFSLCGQNIKMFDIPFLGKRCFINGIHPPKSFPTHDSKPWELNVVDTKDVWSFGNKWGLSSLDIITSSLGIDSSKDGDVKGNTVTSSFYENKHEEIKDYCERDVMALIDIITKLNNLK
jgi:hypothetical protein